MNTTSIGQKAEKMVAEYLRARGYLIFAHNWKKRSCEIDLVAYKNETVYFVEVKYRSNGYGLVYITPTKYRQMQYAARMWCQFNNWHASYELSAASVDSNYTIEFMKEI